MKISIHILKQKNKFNTYHKKKESSRERFPEYIEENEFIYPNLFEEYIFGLIFWL